MIWDGAVPPRGGPVKAHLHDSLSDESRKSERGTYKKTVLVPCCTVRCVCVCHVQYWYLPVKGCGPRSGPEMAADVKPEARRTGASHGSHARPSDCSSAGQRATTRAACLHNLAGRISVSLQASISAKELHALREGLDSLPAAARGIPNLAAVFPLPRLFLSSQGPPAPD